MNAELRQLADALGVLPGFHDMAGVWQATDEVATRALVRALGFPADDPAQVGRALATLDDEAKQRPAPRDWISVENETVHLALAHPVTWRLVRLSDGAVVDEGEARHTLTLAPLAMGRYRIEYRCGDERTHTVLLVIPTESPVRRTLAREASFWGVMAPLYGLRSKANLGVGDYADLARLANIAGRAGADFVGINPVHALPVSTAAAFSPYSPDHRAFLDINAIAPDRVHEFRHSDAAREHLAGIASDLEMLRASELVDHGRSAQLRAPILEALHQTFLAAPPASERRREFERWRRARGPALRHFATFRVLGEHFGPDRATWAFADSQAPGIEEFQRANADRIGYHEYLQFVADSQLHDVAQEARNAGMQFGLYLDLAVGTNLLSSEVWANPGAFVTSASLGAPPDHFNPTGQRWDLAPFHPHALHALDYEPFAEVIRAAMRHAGIIRIDHVLGLTRSFWVPEEGGGGYVTYPFDALLAVLSIEAAAHDCVVVGEDLGLVPDGLRERMGREEILGCRVMQFERLGQEFRSPSDYPRISITSFGSHDVPTIRGWWLARDVDAMLQAGLIDASSAERMREERGRLRQALWAKLRRYGVLDNDAVDPPDDLDTPELLAVHRFIASAQSLLLGVALDDIVGADQQQNLPGTVDTYPNWRRRIPEVLEVLAEDDRWLAHTAALNRLRGRNPEQTGDVAP